MPISITYWRDVLRKLTTTEMDNNFENLANAIENAGLSPTMPEGQIYIGDNTNTASLDTLDTSIVPETTDRNYQTDNQKLFNDATSSIQTQIDSKEPTISSGTTSQYWRGDKTWQTFPTATVPNLDEVTDVGNTTTNSIEVGGLVVDMPSGSGVAVNITKGGNEEGLKVHKTSGSGNVATITGGTTLISQLDLTTPLADSEIASASIWNNKFNTPTGLTNNLYTYYDTSTSSFKSGRIGWVTSLDFFAVYRSDLSTANSITINSTNNAIVYTQSGSNLLGLDYTSYARLGGNGGAMLMASVGSFANGYFWVTNGNNYHANTIHHFADNPGTVQARLSTSGLAIGSSTINASAQLDLQSTTKGFLKPRLTSAQIASISTPAQGLNIFNTDLRSDVIIPTSSGNPIRVSGTMFTQTVNAQVQNTVTETSLIGTGIGSNTIKANSSGIGTTYRLSMWGYISNTGSPFAQIKIKIGSVVIFDTTSSGMFAITGNQNFKVSALFTVRSLGASGTVIGQGEFEYATSASTQYQILFQTNTATSTIDTTTDQTIDVTFTWNTANASNSINSTNYLLERL